MGKGATFERKFCRDLSMWWTDGKDDDVFWRTDGSGGRATRRGKSGKRTDGRYGDVCAIKPVGAMVTDLLTIELKRGYHRDTFQDLIDRYDTAATQTYEDFLDQTITAHELAGSFAWLCVVMRTRRNGVVMMPRYLYRNLSAIGAFDPMPRPFLVLSANVKIGGHRQRMDIAATTDKGFFETILPEHLRELSTIA